MKTSDLIGRDLDRAVQFCIAKDDALRSALRVFTELRIDHPSTDWAQGGPIIEHMKIQLSPRLNGLHKGQWAASIWNTQSGSNPSVTMYGPTPLVAASRCYVEYMCHTQRSKELV